MIRETLSRRRSPALTSDRWHVVHARWSGDRSGEPRFLRTIVSEHEDRVAARSAARAVVDSIAGEMADRPQELRDQILVRRPGFKSLKSAKRVQRRRR
jgi:hypothetical protein